MKKLVILLWVVVFAFSLSAQWKVLDEGKEARTLSSCPPIKVEVTVPPYEVEKVTINGKACIVLYMKDASMYMKQGYPMVPKLTKLVKVHDRCNIKLEVLSKEEVTVPLEAPIAPSKGHFTREIPYDSVPFEFGPIYKQDVYWPSEKEQFEVGESFLFRDVRGVRLQILPIRANHVQMKMMVLKKAIVQLTFEETMNGVNTLSNRVAVKHGKTFRKLYDDAFLNPPVNTEENVRGGTVPPENNKRLVVVTPKDYESTLAAWIDWKKKNGYEVTVKSYASGTAAATIKADLQALYDNSSTKFGYVVIIGDSDVVPTFKGKYESADADRVYVRLAGNDNYPDAFISRVSGTTSEVTAQLNKIMKYEQTPPAGSWYNKGICIASDQGSPTDKERAEWIQNGGGTSQKVPVEAGGLIKYGITAFDDIYDPSASASQVTNAVNDGRSVIFYIGHGSSTSWGTTGFNTNNARNLSNGTMLPTIFSVACVNGDFVRYKECFAEAWLRNPNGGAVAMEAASTNEAWVPPCDKQAATINAIIKKTHTTFGALETVGCVKGLEAWGDTDKGQGNQMAEQCNLFGDCTILVRTKAPNAITAQAIRGLDRNVNFSINSYGRSVANATVTVYTQDLSFVVTGDTDEAGNVNISLENCPSNAALFYTVVGTDLMPIIDQTLE